MRSGSRRIKNKNFLKIGSKSMFEHVLNEANKSKIFDTIHLSTENFSKLKKLKRLCLKKKFKNKVEANFIRPKNLAYDNVPMFKVIDYIVKNYNQQDIIFDKFCLIYSTAIFIKSNDFIKIFTSFKKINNKNLKHGISLQTISKFPAPLQWSYNLKKNGILIPKFKNSFKNTSDKFNKAYFDTGGLHFFNLKFLSRKYKKKKYGHIVNYVKSIDVDFKEDLETIKYLKKKLN